jgi:23S rRNA (uracil1939-C5)-methyltransferase
LGRKKLPFYEKVVIEDIAAEGKSLVRIDERVVFVKDAVPGDVVDLQVFRKKKGFMEARVTNFHAYSEVRTQPFCAHFGICGGCKWQQLPYAEQLKYKNTQVLDALRHIGKIEIPEHLPIVGADQDRYYRNKLEYTFSNRRWLLQEEADSGLPIEHTNALGFHVPGRFDKVVDIRHCYLQDDPSNEIRNILRDIALYKGASFYDHTNNEGLLRNLIIRTSSLGEVMIILSFQFDEPVIYEIMEELRERIDRIDSFMYTINPKKNETLYDLEIKTFAGKDHIFERLEDLTFKIGPKSFFQTNTAQALQLYRITRDFAELTGKEILYDLYTGTGTIANFLAAGAKKVIGIESVPEAIEDARMNSEINGIANTLFFAGDMRDTFNEDFIKAHGRPDVLITDPPRAGMHPKVVDQIIKLAPGRIVYVSCNPATQARDLQLLSDTYSLVKIQPVDMFPHTHHVENVALLVLKASS